ncbi:hypothetical protein UFOVP1224_19 [uncultured Caudovirales phage]|uniref:Bacteriophage lambda, Stf, side tail fibre-repeat-2 n=1 Tax=uncultured Caudovirales phage TaxID=2100421 RepID=A0A6J5R311_9CAUD|nr:hypothetical protein UFOVP1224_19 [uncultured Caudovirales phage]
MANPTTAFGWVMPTTTDLVTDLPADFAVFGQGVDTSMQYLLGGTTGQVLSKTSATNMAFTWATPQVGDITEVTAGTGITVTSPTGPIPTVSINTAVTADLTTAQTLTNKTLTSPALTTPTISTLTTNGDSLYGTGSGAIARLGIGSTGQVLTVAGGLPSWATPAGGGFDLITTVDASAATTVSFTSIAGTYDHLLLIWQGVFMSTATQYLDVKFNSTSANYSFMGIYQAPTSTGLYTGSTSSIGGAAEYAPVPFCPASNLVEDNGRGQMWIYNYASSSISKRFQFSGEATSAASLATTRGMVNGNGLWNNTAAITQVDFIRSSTATITGKFQLWGVK